MSDVQENAASPARSAMVKAMWRILPLIVISYLAAYIDRVNISFAAAKMNADLQFTATIYGLGGGLFFLGYALFEVPSNLLLARFGPRTWIARIMVTWGLLAAAMIFVRTPMQFYALRFLLGVAEAGFFPGVIFFLALWFPAAYRGGAISLFYAAGPLASIVMGGLSAWLLDLDGHMHLHGWQWLFLVQGLPAVALGLLVLAFLPDTPGASAWLAPKEKAWIATALDEDAARIGQPVAHSLLAALRHPFVWQLGAIGFLTTGPNLAFILSAPTVLHDAAGLDMKQIGHLVTLGGALGCVSIILAGFLSDRRGERLGPALLGALSLAVIFGVLAVFHSPGVVIAAYLCFAVTCFTTQMLAASAWPDVLHPRLLVVGAAAINMLANLGGFVAPYAWGAARDATGGYHLGLMSLPVAYLVAAALILNLRRQLRGKSLGEPGLEPAVVDA